MQSLQFHRDYSSRDFCEIVADLAKMRKDLSGKNPPFRRCTTCVDASARHRSRSSALNTQRAQRALGLFALFVKLVVCLDSISLGELDPALRFSRPESSEISPDGLQVVIAQIGIHLPRHRRQNVAARADVFACLHGFQKCVFRPCAAFQSGVGVRRQVRGVGDAPRATPRR